MQQAAKAIAAFHPAVRGWGHFGRSACRPLPEPLVRPGLVIVLQELRQHPLKVPAAEDQQVIEALTPRPEKTRLIEFGRRAAEQRQACGLGAGYTIRWMRESKLKAVGLTD